MLYQKIYASVLIKTIMLQGSARSRPNVGLPSVKKARRLD
jgi:hypothetical protein